MNNRFGYIIFKEEALQSNVFAQNYEQYFDSSNAPALNSPLFEDISSVLNEIITKCETLTDFQKSALYKIFDSFNEIRYKIDPKRLKSFEYFLNHDDELLLYRSTPEGLTNIIIHPLECLAYSYISKTSDIKKLEFYNLDGDFEHLSYSFFSK